MPTIGGCGKVLGNAVEVTVYSQYLMYEYLSIELGAETRQSPLSMTVSGVRVTPKL
jgi:hypothetical protein